MSVNAMTIRIARFLL